MEADGTCGCKGELSGRRTESIEAPEIELEVIELSGEVSLFLIA